MFNDSMTMKYYFSFLLFFLMLWSAIPAAVPSPAVKVVTAQQLPPDTDTIIATLYSVGGASFLLAVGAVVSLLLGILTGATFFLIIAGIGGWAATLTALFTRRNIIDDTERLLNLIGMGGIIYVALIGLILLAL